MNSLKRQRVIESVSEVKQLIKKIRYYCPHIVCIGRGTDYLTFNGYKAVNGWKSFNFTSVIELTDVKLKITTKYGKEWLKVCTYIFDLNEVEDFSATGLKCFTEFSKSAMKIKKAADYHYERLDKWFDEESGKYVCSAKPILGYNKKYEGLELKNCYEYDINSAYFNTLLEKMPDLNNPRFDTKLKEGEVGFLLDDDLTMVEEKGCWVNAAFPLIKTPKKVIDFAKKWYDIKKNSTGNKKLEAKAMLNLPIGYCQRYNPFLRSYVVSKCNNLIARLVKGNKESTLFWNTDAIFTLNKKLSSLEIGSGIGQFKEIKCDTIRYKGNTYQINDDLPVYRGIPKAWFEAFNRINGRKFNILKDSLPNHTLNKWNWNWEKLSLEENDYGKKEIN